MVHTLIARMIGLEAEGEREREGDRDGERRSDGVRGGERKKGGYY